MAENYFFVYTALLSVLFIGTFFWAFGKKRKKRLDGDREISFQDKQ